jgi:hypothetical protein
MALVVLGEQHDPASLADAAQVFAGTDAGTC